MENWTVLDIAQPLSSTVTNTSRLGYVVQIFLGSKLQKREKNFYIEMNNDKPPTW